MTNSGGVHGNGEIVEQVIEILRPTIEKLVEEKFIKFEDGCAVITMFGLTIKICRSE